MRELKVPFVPRNVYEFNSQLMPALKLLCPSESHRFHCEDLLKVGLGDLEQCEGLVAGPPCPPWSSLGARASEWDSRADVFKRVVEWIFVLSAGSLKWFVLENVCGIMARSRKDAAAGSFLDKVLAKLREGLKEH